MKVYDLDTEKERILIDIVRESSKGNINSINDLTESLDFLENLYARKRLIWAIYPLYGLLISSIISIFLLIILKNPIGGWRWPISIIVFIIISFFSIIYLSVLKDEEKENEISETVKYFV